jgi:hypothetical protein
LLAEGSDMAVSYDMRGARARTLSAAGGPALPPYADDPEILAWTNLLLRGKPDEQARARTEIGLILEARGDLAAAEDVYWSAVQVRGTDRRAYQRLLVLYQKRGDRLSETLVLKQLEEVFGDGSDMSADSSSPAPRLPAEERGNRMNTLPLSREAGEGVGERGPRRRLRRRHEAHRASDTATAASAEVVEGRALVKVAQVATGGGRRGGQRARVGDAPTPRPFARSGSLIVLQPSTVGAILLASIGTAALIALVLIVAGRTGFSFGGAGQVPARCVDASVRFPGASDPRAAVVAAYRQNGIDAEATRPGGARLTPEAATQVIGGWIGASLLLERAGQPAPSLATWLSTDADRATLANALVSGRTIDRLLTADEWAEVQDWPASTCEGAFVRDPRNAALMQLVERVVVR